MADQRPPDFPAIFPNPHFWVDVVAESMKGVPDVEQIKRMFGPAYVLGASHVINILMAEYYQDSGINEEAYEAIGNLLGRLVTKIVIDAYSQVYGQEIGVEMWNDAKRVANG